MKPKETITKVVIIGAGTMGRHIAGLLQAEDLDVVLIDRNRQALVEVAEMFDVQTLYGNGASPEVLERAGIREAQLLLAFTDSCEVNLLAAFFAKQMAPVRTVVRARSAWSLDTSRVNLRKCLDIDLLLNPEQLTAVEIVKFLDNPNALAINHYAQGKVQLRQFILDRKSPFCHSALIDCKMPPGVLVVTRSRDDEVVIPKGNHVLFPGDKLTIIGLPDRMAEAQRLFHAESEPVRNVTIAGGGNGGLFLAETLETRNFSVKLIDPDLDRCEYLSERLPRTTIIRGDVTRMGFLKEERIGSSDVFIAVAGDDEDNVMACLLAKELGVKQTVARINRPDYAFLVQKTGIDLAVSPRHVTADRVMTLVLGSRVERVSLMEEGKVQVIELRAEKGAPLVGKPLIEIGTPEGVLIAAIVRHGHVTVPRGEDQIRTGDTVIVVGLSEKVDEVEKQFQAP
ncbi:MAG TPA: Trk system potassium transporter TrkA [Sumerlaeia bacterium]|nr:Trk system potassium transporter TrkA [Sumerlaeia bacterium]